MLQGVKLAACATGEAPLVWTSSPVAIPAAATAVAITLRKVTGE
jgi:hypothetical protein